MEIVFWMYLSSLDLRRTSQPQYVAWPISWARSSQKNRSLGSVTTSTSKTLRTTNLSTMTSCGNLGFSYQENSPLFGKVGRLNTYTRICTYLILTVTYLPPIQEYHHQLFYVFSKLNIVDIDRVNESFSEWKWAGHSRRTDMTIGVEIFLSGDLESASVR